MHEQIDVRRVELRGGFDDMRQPVVKLGSCDDHSAAGCPGLVIPDNARKMRRETNPCSGFEPIVRGRVLQGRIIAKDVYRPGRFAEIERQRTTGRLCPNATDAKQENRETKGPTYQKPKSQSHTLFPPFTSSRSSA